MLNPYDLEKINAVLVTVRDDAIRTLKRWDDETLFDSFIFALENAVDQLREEQLVPQDESARTMSS